MPLHFGSIKENNKMKQSSLHGTEATSNAANVSVPVGSVWQIFRIWLSIGLQSFGGGATTQYLIRREMI